MVAFQNGNNASAGPDQTVASVPQLHRFEILCEPPCINSHHVRVGNTRTRFQLINSDNEESRIKVSWTTIDRLYDRKKLNIVLDPMDAMENIQRRQ